MRGWINALRHLASGQSAPSADTLSDVEESLVVQMPPVLLRLNVGETPNHETTPQFISEGWCRGESHPLANPFLNMVYATIPGNQQYFVERLEIHLRKDISVDVVQIVSVEGRTFTGPCVMTLFCPQYMTLPDSDGNEAPLTCSATGGITDDFSSLMKQLAIKLCSKIISVETSTDGYCLVIFAPWREQLILSDFCPELTKDIDNEVVDNPNGKVEDGEGT